jgi:hypothetical protein
MFSPFLNALWIAAAGLKMIIAVFLTATKFYRRYPLFYSYAVYNVVLNASLLIVKVSYPAYFYTFWAGRILDVVLGFAVIYEIFTHLFSRYDALRKLTSMLFKWTAAALLLVGVALSASPSADSSQLIGGILVAERSIAVIQTGLLVFLFIFASSFGISWRHYIFGISAGFGVLGSVKLAVLAIRTQVGGSATNLFNIVQMVAYIAALCIWMSYLATREPESPRLTSVPSTNLEAWNHALRQVLER